MCGNSGAPLDADTWAIALCAEWCGTCREWRAVFDRARPAHPQLRWRWLDIEDEAELLDDMDIETLPCLLLARGDQVLFFGPILPQPEVLSRLVETFSAQAEPASAVDGAVAALWRRLRNTG
jgi:thioredoxin 1